MLQPVVRRTWAPKGHTPVLPAWDRHDRLSVISAVTLAPRRQRLGLYWSVQTQNIRGPDVAAFLRRVRRGLQRKIVLILDRWNVHRSKVMRECLDRLHASVRVEWLPAYAPDLNPTEQVWNHAKYCDLANFIPDDRADLHAHVETSITAQHGQSDLLRSFFQTAKLKL